MEVSRKFWDAMKHTDDTGMRVLADENKDSLLGKLGHYKSDHLNV